MLDLMFGGRKLIFESPLTLEEATRRLQNEIAVLEWRVYENRQQSFRARSRRMTSSRGTLQSSVH
jgi:hypothetical protein